MSFFRLPVTVSDEKTLTLFAMSRALLARKIMFLDQLPKQKISGGDRSPFDGQCPPPYLQQPPRPFVPVCGCDPWRNNHLNMYRTPRHGFGVESFFAVFLLVAGDGGRDGGEGSEGTKSLDYTVY